MTKREIIKEIKNLNKKERYLAGNKIKRLPVYRDRYNNGIPSIELPIVYLKYWYSTDLNTLTKRTLTNVLYLKKRFNIDWFFIVKYKVEKEYSNAAQRHSWMIYGLWNKQLVTFYRKETKCTCAGQTNLYFGEGFKIQTYKLINSDWIHEENMVEQKDSWLRCVKRLYKYVNDSELEKIILLYS